MEGMSELLAVEELVNEAAPRFGDAFGSGEVQGGNAQEDLLPDFVGQPGHRVGTVFEGLGTVHAARPDREMGHDATVAAAVGVAVMGPA